MRLPACATREAIANAICHREYTIPGGAVAMCDDHLEITYPGTFHFGITPEKLTRPHESKPWNPIIANVFYRAGIIERWGAGTLNIIEWCKENGNSPPTWEDRAGSVYVIFWPAVLRHGDEVTPEVRLLKALAGEMTRQQLQTALNLKDDEHFRKAYLLPTLQAGLIEMTIPDKPRSSKQKYRLTEKGRKFLSGFEGDDE